MKREAVPAALIEKNKGATVVYFTLIISIISFIAAAISGAIAFIAYFETRKDSHYVDIDHQYADLLNIALDNTDFRYDEKTTDYLALPPDNDFRRKYEIYAYMCWNFLETIHDRHNEMNTWLPVILEENRLHYIWFRHNLKLFKTEFQNYIIKTINETELDVAGAERLDKIYKHYVSDFPLDEQKTFDQLTRILQKDRYEIILLRHKKYDEIIGYAFVYSDDTTLWLDYMAIDHKFRNAGYGTLLFNKILEKKAANKAGMFLEVENLEPDDSDNSNNAKRIRFYERLGAQRLPIDYKLPTKDGPYPMSLYFKPVKGVKVLREEELRQSISSIFGYIHSDIADAEIVAADISLQDISLNQ